MPSSSHSLPSPESPALKASDLPSDNYSEGTLPSVSVGGVAAFGPTSSRDAPPIGETAEAGGSQPPVSTALRDHSRRWSSVRTPRPSYQSGGNIYSVGYDATSPGPVPDGAPEAWPGPSPRYPAPEHGPEGSPKNSAPESAPEGSPTHSAFSFETDREEPHVGRWSGDVSPLSPRNSLVTLWNISEESEANRPLEAVTPVTTPQFLSSETNVTSRTGTPEAPEPTIRICNPKDKGKAVADTQIHSPGGTQIADGSTTSAGAASGMIIADAVDGSSGGHCGGIIAAFGPPSDVEYSNGGQRGGNTAALKSFYPARPVGGHSSGQRHAKFAAFTSPTAVYGSSDSSDSLDSFDEQLNKEVAAAFKHFESPAVGGPSSGRTYGETAGCNPPSAARYSSGGQKDAEASAARDSSGGQRDVKPSAARDSSVSLSRSMTTKLRHIFVGREGGRRHKLRKKSASTAESNDPPEPAAREPVPERHVHFE
ncbi:hypothetical protein QBC33DRAFT_510820 [Phialemonium atrogriseum]|uniref:Uncharacterized protein n=1 Tax=Phialemonium atrogriseum TaxID=1093897 RepID=A0AAJ0FQI4_9PEZI|nr:uncharacterized protein QBC33DRAFT_510820 [Phialemonium atrogriseum]KAK1771284.1 hypothetical protein QBC33DRAFT_510820 [Phialemonium atrogriseum]